MATVKVFISERDIPMWAEVTRQIEIDTKPVEADVSIVIGGGFLNPLALSGKKVLFYDRKTFNDFALFERIMYNYYDEMHDLTGLSPKEKVKAICDTKKSRS